MNIPSAHRAQEPLRRSGVNTTSRRQRVAILPPLRIDDHRAMKAAAQTLVEELRARAVGAGLARTAFATLVDNGLTHADDGAGPVAAVYLERGRISITSRDSGQAIACCKDPKLELVRRIQFAAEDADPAPGAPAGIPWLAHQVATRCSGGQLEFMAGTGRLTFKDCVWSCSQGLEVRGFAALALLPVAAEE